MSLTDRDKKIVFALVPLVLILGYWFLVLAPKRSEAERLGTQLEEVEQARDGAVATAASLEGSRDTYAKDYSTVVRLGKAIPSSVDMPGLLVQLDGASRGTQIRMGKVTVGSRVAAAAPAPPAPGGTAPPAAPDGDAAAGGAPAQSTPGQPAETAGNAVQDANQTSATQSGDPAAAAPAAPGATGASTATAPGLDSVPLTFEFSGGFFDLADFFHEMKRFVFVANERVRVDGRLLTIDGFKFDSTTFPTIKAEVQATVYLSPKTQGVTAGASPAAPAPGAPVPAGQTVPEPAPPASAGTASPSVGVQ